MRALVLCALVLAAPGALAARLELALRIPLEPIRAALDSHLSTVYRDGRCSSLRLQGPKLDGVGPHLQLTAPGSGALGFELLGRCQNAVAWRGTVQFTLAPLIDRAGRLRLRIVDSALTDEGGSTPGLGLAWELTKRHQHPRLERFSYDIGASRSALLGVLASAAPPELHSDLQQALAQLQVLEPRAQAGSVVVPVAIEFPDAWRAGAAPMPGSAAPLTEAELEALDIALQPWDAFISYAIKQVALDSEDSRLRQRLFTLLLDSRYQLAAILAGEVSGAADPARALFIDAWNELRAIIAEAQRERVLDASLLRYAAFIDAGDALVALDRAAPGLGVRVSADGLRQLARSLRPGVADDPLAYAWAVDPQMKGLFTVEGLPQAAPPPGRSWLEFLIRSAHATPAQVPERWVPNRDELPAYEAYIGGLLQKAATVELERSKLGPPYHEIYEHLVPTTALIESCWRQYVARAGKVTYLRSAAASVGIMQINQRVWRGFYEVERLRWDTAYNVRAGAQILMRYVKDYAIPFAAKSGDPNHVARAAYAVYNAGPRAAGRFAKAEPHPREKRVDDHLWTLYQGIAAGGRADLRTCGVEIAAASK